MSKLGMQTFHYAEMSKNPEKAAEFAERLNLLTKDSNMNEWLQGPTGVCPDRGIQAKPA